MWDWVCFALIFYLIKLDIKFARTPEKHIHKYLVFIKMYVSDYFAGKGLPFIKAVFFHRIYQNIPAIIIDNCDQIQVVISVDIFAISHKSQAKPV